MVNEQHIYEEPHYCGWVACGVVLTSKTFCMQIAGNIGGEFAIYILEHAILLHLFGFGWWGGVCCLQ